MHVRRLPTSVLLTLLTAVVVVVAVASETLCKKPCECSDKGYVDCTNRALTSTNSALDGLPAAARVLNLSSNAFPTLYRRMFVAASELRVLVVSKCGVETIDGEALHGLGSLKMLYCSNNRLEMLDPKTFYATPLIQWIVFFRNALRRVDAGSFSGLKDLLYVDLSHNSIEHVDAGSFGHNPKLVSVSLNANRLTRLDIFLSVPRLKTLSLGHNRLVCGCGLISLRTWIDDGRKIDVRNATCDRPPAAAKRLFENVTVVDLHCWSAHELTSTRSERCDRPNVPNRGDGARCERFVCGVDNVTYSLSVDDCGGSSNSDPDRRSGVGPIAGTICGFVALAAISVGAIVFVVRRRRRIRSGKNVNRGRADDGALGAVGFGRRSSDERTTRPTVSEPQPDGEYEENFLYGLRIS